MEKVFFWPDTNLSKKITQLNTKNKLNDFVKSWLWVTFNEIIKIFEELIRSNKTYNS